MKEGRIRNFSLIAHIDHGKSTLADRILEYTQTLPPREIREQTLDTMDLERERGITIKAHTIRLLYRTKKGEEYILNLVDTPGHVDFTYEVSRSLASTEGCVLLVDGVQGVEAQTVANLNLAKERNLVIIPAISKIDLPLANPSRVKKQLEELGVNPDEVILTSGKNGTGVEELLEAIVERIPPPPSLSHHPLKALIFDSLYDSHRGIVGYIRIFEGKIRPGMEIKPMSTGKVFRVEEVGIFKLKREPRGVLSSGEIGYFISNLKDIREFRVGDTITLAARPTSFAFPGYREPKPMVLCGFYPASEESFDRLKNALFKLKLNDASFTFKQEFSPLLGMGFRLGFLGLLHKDIIQERLEREYGLKIVSTSPHVLYRIRKKDDSWVEVNNLEKFPPLAEIKEIEEPWIKGIIFTPQEYVGRIMRLAEEKRGKLLEIKWTEGGKVNLTYKFPLAEVALGFYDRLKSVSQGYASFDYEWLGFEKEDLVKLEVLVNGKVLPALSFIVHRKKAYRTGKKLLERLKEVIPRELFRVTLQARAQGKIISREDIPALRKDVTAPLYGGDVTRKRKLLERQREGKKRMRKFGKVSIPQEAFMAVLES